MFVQCLAAFHFDRKEKNLSDNSCPPTTRIIAPVMAITQCTAYTNNKGCPYCHQYCHRNCNQQLVNSIQQLYHFYNAQLSTIFGYLRVHPSQRSRMTPKKASPNIPPDIFEVPSLRLTKITGTSLILKPIL